MLMMSSKTASAADFVEVLWESNGRTDSHML